jgi:hypothetical protein
MFAIYLVWERILLFPHDFHIITMGTQEETLTDDRADLGERVEVLNSLDIPDISLVRFLNSKNIRSPEPSDDDFRLKVAGKLNEELLEELRVQYKYAGRQTINYFVFTDIQKTSLHELEEKFCYHFPTEEDVEGVLRKPYLADSEVVNGKLYLAFGYFKSIGGKDPATGRSKPDRTTGRSIAVVDDDMDLVELRGSDTRMVDTIKEEMGESLGNYRESSLFQPNFNREFEEAFNRLVEKYYNLKVRVEQEEGSTVDTISFSSVEDEAGERKDAREDKRVSKELEERGGEITLGYVELDEGFKFQINRKQSKLSFRASYQEAKLNEVTEIINDVLKQTGGYSQQTFDRFENVPE